MIDNYRLKVSLIISLNSWVNNSETLIFHFNTGQMWKLEECENMRLKKQNVFQVKLTFLIATIWASSESALRISQDKGSWWRWSKSGGKFGKHSADFCFELLLLIFATFDVRKFKVTALILKYQNNTSKYGIWWILDWNNFLIFHMRLFTSVLFWFLKVEVWCDISKIFRFEIWS